MPSPNDLCFSLSVRGQTEPHAESEPLDACNCQSGGIPHAEPEPLVPVVVDKAPPWQVIDGPGHLGGLSGPDAAQEDSKAIATVRARLQMLVCVLEIPYEDSREGPGWCHLRVTERYGMGGSGEDRGGRMEGGRGWAERGRLGVGGTPGDVEQSVNDGQAAGTVCLQGDLLARHCTLVFDPGMLESGRRKVEVMSRVQS